MASKVLVKMPSVTFSQELSQNNNGNTVDDSYQAPIEKSNLGYQTKSNQISQRSAGNEPGTPPLYPPRPLDPIIRFLQEQHQLMLAGLHAEIESLKKKNTELQFQLVFSKNKSNAPCSIPSSPEDDSSKSQISLSPKEINEAPLQVELLEKDLSETKISLQHANTRSACLAALVDEQNKKIEAMRATGLEENEPDPDLQHALQESERLVRCLRRENDEHRRELTSLRAALAGQENANQNQACASTGRGRGRNQPNQRNNAGNNRHMGNHQSGRQGGHQFEQARFPRLPTQNFWHQKGKLDESESPDPNFQGALQEAERVVRCLQRENDDQRRELAALRAALAGQNQAGGSSQRGQRGKNPSISRNNSGSNRHQTGRPGGHQYEQQPRFPRLQTQSYWNQRGQDFGNLER